LVSPFLSYILNFNFREDPVLVTHLLNLVLDSSPLSTPLVKIGLDVITTILKSPEFRAEREKYLTFSLQNIKAEHSIPQSLSIILHILSTYGDNGGFSFLKINLEDIVSRLNKEWGNVGGILGGVLRDLEKYILKIKEFAGERIEKEKVINFF
jgi:hypothetical protein